MLELRNRIKEYSIKCSRYLLFNKTAFEGMLGQVPKLNYPLKILVFVPHVHEIA